MTPPTDTLTRHQIEAMDRLLQAYIETAERLADAMEAVRLHKKLMNDLVDRMDAVRWGDEANAALTGGVLAVPSNGVVGDPYDICDSCGGSLGWDVYDDGTDHDMRICQRCHDANDAAHLRAAKETT